jgi:hypothetical protein
MMNIGTSAQPGKARIWQHNDTPPRPATDNRAARRRSFTLQQFECGLAAVSRADRKPSLSNMPRITN